MPGILVKPKNDLPEEIVNFITDQFKKGRLRGTKGSLFEERISSPDGVDRLNGDHRMMGRVKYTSLIRVNKVFYIFFRKLLFWETVLNWENTR